jgi:hypothetical protein
MSNRDWQLIKAELQATISMSSTKPAVKNDIPRQKVSPKLRDDTDVALDQIAKALRQSRD